MSIIEFLSQPIWQRLGLTLVHFLWQGLAVIIFTNTCVHVFKPGHGSARYLIYLAAFIAMIACPIVTFIEIDIPMSPDKARLTEIESVEPLNVLSNAVLPEGGVSQQVDTPIPTMPGRTEVDTSIAVRKRITCRLYILLPWLLVFWMVGVLVLSMRLLMGLVGIHRWCRHLMPLPERLGQRLSSLSEALGMGGFSRVFMSPSVVQVMAVGYLRPMVLLPTAMVLQMQPEMLEAVIAHELAHIRRFDLWVNLLQRITETLLFYHPAVWWLSGCLRSEREHCCDDLAVKATGERLTYASALESIARGRLAARQPALAVALSQNNKPVLRRVRHILGLVPGKRIHPFWLAGIIALLLLTIITISTVMALSAKTRSTENTETDTTINNEEASIVFRLLDPNGLPVRGVKVGKHLSIHSDARVRNLVSFDSAQTDEKGLVSFQENDLFQERNQNEKLLLYALGTSQELAGFLEVSPDQCDGVIDWQLQPACKVNGRLESSSLEKLGQKLEWTNVYLYKDRYRPLSYSSRERQFVFFLPHGSYKLNAYGTSTYSINQDIDIEGGQKELKVELDLPADRLATLKGKTAPEFRHIKGWINSEPLTLAQLRGKFVLLDFWGYWCGPCVRAMPDLMQFSDKLSKYGLTIIAIHDDSLDSIEELQGKLKSLSEKRWSGRSIPFAVALDGGGQTKIDETDRFARGATTAAYGIQGWPTSILIDNKGNVVKKFYPSHSNAFGELQDFLGIRLVDHSPDAKPTTPKGWVGGMLRARGLDSRPFDPTVHLVRTDNNLSLWSMRDEYAQVDENGNYAYFNVPFGHYLLRVEYGRMMGDTVCTLFLFQVDVQSSRRPYWMNLEYEPGSCSLDVKCPGFYSVTLWCYDHQLKCWIEWAKYLGRVLPDKKVEYMDQYTFKNLPPGNYGVVAVRQVGNNVLTQRAQFELKENQHSSCSLRIEQHSAILEGKVIGYRGDVSDLRVLVRQAGAGPIQFATIYEASTRDSIAVIRGLSPDGGYTCPALPAGKYTITAAQFPPGHRQYRGPIQQVSKLVELKEGQTTIVNFDLLSNTETPPATDGP